MQSLTELLSERAEARDGAIMNVTAKIATPSLKIFLLNTRISYFVPLTKKVANAIPAELYLIFAISARE
ncbi:MAG: hypothetical protein HC883_02410 [Bdellovibrionaceae bacterium]|nr:hypothetical protein [Pseudobdellovibrionaceae bacterium]